MFGITGDRSTVALDPGVCNTMREGGCRLMVAWVREEEKAPENRQMKRKVEEVDKVEVTP